MEYVLIIIAIVVFAVVTAAGLVVGTRRRGRAGTAAPGHAPDRPQPGTDYPPGVGDDAEVPRDSPRRTVDTVDLPADLDIPAPPTGAETGLYELELEKVPELEVPAPAAGRLVRLRARLARSQSSLGRGLLLLLSGDNLDEEVWEDVETTLLVADVGVTPTEELVASLRTKVKVLGARRPADVHVLLRDELLAQIGTSTDRTVQAFAQGRPANILVVGVNGTGKTTTCGKIARLLVADGRRVVLGAADTFRAAAADQLETWGSRVGAYTVRGSEGGDPASVAFEAAKRGISDGVDTVVIDTAGRLHTKTGLMDELSKIKKVVAKLGPVDEVLLVLDATTGQNAVEQARVFTQAVDITGVVLTKLDGTAKGGIVIAVQRELGVPVKLIGLGEGPDDLAPFEPEAFVDALLGDPPD
ncbi:MULTISPECIES: signal recognition particle-docking protein FtsY [Protofrankia]|uniref:Signal recognition particle receptor FtsY n=1 Tax=Candidatus Protofrankia datiscae TaxID=2716812 RepID=F8B448_9ACTN|nr:MULTISPECIES: signal recognition particle-docking protein FtsY [Protofrankia]AEH10956.1 signal recognition particle-docking protein FtsY [Candidatus Protofrankia datiscae]